MSTVSVVNVKHPSSASNNLVLDNAGNATFAGTVVPASSFLRNRIINGDQRIAQRGTGAVTAAGQFPVDRFWINHAFDGVVNAQQSAIAPPGFTNSTGFTVATPDTSLGASQFFNFRQRIEGFNIADFGFGAAGAQTITLSFWVRSSVTGTYAVSISNEADTRVYPASYNINAANTWEYKTIVIPGDTTGTWRTDNGTGMQVQFQLAIGSGFQGTPNVWNAGGIYAPSGLANWVGTNGATFYLTGVQLEVGSVATPFERRQYGQELALCYRYAYAWGGLGAFELAAASTPGMYSDANQIQMMPAGINPGSMRTLAPTITVVGTQGTDWAVQSAGGVNQTGFTITMGGGVIVASKAGHGITNGNCNLLALTANGRIIAATEL